MHKFTYFYETICILSAFLFLLYRHFSQEALSRRMAQSNAVSLNSTWHYVKRTIAMLLRCIAAESDASPDRHVYYSVSHLLRSWIARACKMADLQKGECNQLRDLEFLGSCRSLVAFARWNLLPRVARVIGGCRQCQQITESRRRDASDFNWIPARFVFRD